MEAPAVYVCAEARRGVGGMPASCFVWRKKMRRKRTREELKKRPDMYGAEQGLYKKNRALLRKTAERCAICGGVFDRELKYPHPLSISIDHIVPVTKGGSSRLNNLQAVHLVCNTRKGDRIVIERNIKSEPPKMLPQYFDWTAYDG